MPTSTSSDVVALRDGPVVPAVVLQCLWRLEDRGATFTVTDNALHVSPKGILTDEDRAILAAHRAVVLDVIRYCDTYEPRHLL